MRLEREVVWSPGGRVKAGVGRSLRLPLREERGLGLLVPGVEAREPLAVALQLDFIPWRSPLLAMRSRGRPRTSSILNRLSTSKECFVYISSATLTTMIVKPAIRKVTWHLLTWTPPRASVAMKRFLASWLSIWLLRSDDSHDVSGYVPSIFINLIVKV